MNPFLLMMAASKANNKKQEVVEIKSVLVKRKVGRPPAVKKLEPPIIPFPVIDLTTSTTAASKRENYDHGSPKAKMEFALKLVLKSKGKHNHDHNFYVLMLQSSMLLSRLQGTE